MFRHRNIEKWLKVAQVNFNHFIYRSHVVVDKVSIILRILCATGALAALVSIVLAVGFEHDVLDTAWLKRTVNIARLLFVIDILFNLTFNYKKVFATKHPLIWVLDLLVLITFIPVLFPLDNTADSSIVQQILYSKYFIGSVIAVYSIIVFNGSISLLLGKKTNPAVILGVSFLIVILIGSFMLMMPKCTYHGISYIDSLFVSTSAVSITGLTTIDISATFTPLGLLIIAILIQIGGLGILTFTSFFALYFTGNTSIYSQLMMRDMVYTRTMSSLLPTLLYILVFTLVVELLGAAAIFICVHGTLDMTLRDELIFSGFHSLTAFMNAGFSNLEGGLSNPALLHSNQSIYLVASVLILAGGIGFPILVNLKNVIVTYFNRVLAALRLKKLNTDSPIHIYDLNTKVVIYTTLIIFLITAMLFFIMEYNNSLRGMTLYEKAVQSIFNAFVPRSSGFSSVSPSGFLNTTILLMMFLMWIGGASQSTAGGIKVNTFAAIMINLKSIILGRRHVTAYHRHISSNSIRRANAVVTLSILMVVLYTMLLVAFEPQLPVKALSFESVSALFTVGSSLGITHQLGVASKILLCTAMFIGRVGLLSLLMGFFESDRKIEPQYPSGDLIIN